MSTGRKSVGETEESFEESQLLQSLDASIREKDDYEDQVLRNASHQLAPSLHGIGLPSLHPLGPSYSARRPDQSHPADIPHVHTVLKRVRAKQGKESSDHENNLLCMKEQLLLHFLQTTVRVAPEELPIRTETADEARRSMALRNKPPTNDDSKRVSFAPETKKGPIEKTKTKKRARIPIMKRKEAAGMTGDEYQKRREHLRKLRNERQRRKEERQRLLMETGVDELSSNEEENEADFSEGSHMATIENNEPLGDDVVSAQNLVCPICSASIDPRDDDPDQVLSRHIGACQQRSTRRSTRSSSAPMTSFEIGDDDRPVAKPSPRASQQIRKPKRKRPRQVPIVRSTPALDDLDEVDYDDRVEGWVEKGLDLMKVMKERDESETPPGAEDFEGGLHIPQWMNDRLFPYQRKCLQWMWNLHREGAGGIVGDEMGLGKTVQVASFLGALIGSRKAKSVLVIAPATMLRHWLNELAVWAPGLRRILAHASGEVDGICRSVSPSLLNGLATWLKRARSERVFEPIDEEDLENLPPHSFCGTGYCVLTTYENVRRNADLYSAHNWSYVVLDEAQKIRNPDADITLACKRLRTPHRLAMTGTPIQNELKELWSLFDFVFPGRLGTLPAFTQEFADPIKRGGYSNASPMQVQLAYRCALVLRDLVNPFMLRRQKKEVREVSRMPGKTEHVLFCRLTGHQRSLYDAYLRSDEVARVRRGSTNLLAAITMLRKICNHPDLACDPYRDTVDSFGRGTSFEAQNEYCSEDEPGYNELEEDTLVERSGKLEVLSKILPLWKRQGHKVLIFCQWQKMLDIIERFMTTQQWKFGRLDGKTNVAARQAFVDRFNSDDSYFAAICTTRTGGVGLNLVGANRIILYDPDWNPQTDAQARERSWRFGQERAVTVYRLITAGTVEEKIYQRQIFKMALSNKILQDPRQRRLFSQRDLNDLFSLKADTGSLESGGDGLTETTEITLRGGAPEAEDRVSDDNQEAFKTVMKSKGLAGVFDHSFVEAEGTQKTRTALEMEREAKRVARAAAKTLEDSVANTSRFSPTWTGSEETKERRFGSTVGETKSGSGSLLAGLRQRNNAVQTGASENEDTGKYATLLSNIEDYVYRHRPTTDDLLKKFDSVSHDDVAIFRSLLKSVAFVEKGRWRLTAK